MVKKRKAKIKIIYRNKTQKLESPKYKEEIEELSKKKIEVAERIANEKANKKGFGKLFTSIKGLSAQANLNAQIKQRQVAINQPIQLKNAQQRIELEKTKTELNNIRKKNMITFDGLSGYNSNVKQVNFKDLV